MNRKNSKTGTGRKPSATAKASTKSKAKSTSRTVSEDTVMAVYKVMCKNTHKKTGTLLISRTEISSIMNVCDATVDRAIRALKDDGRIKKAKSLYKVVM